MYIVKNALRNIVRAKGRNFLLGCIAFVIGLSACLALSIQEAAKLQRQEGLASLSITANIRMDRQAMMENMPEAQESAGETDQKESFKERLANVQELSLSQLQTYAKAKSVKTFYYTMSTSLNGKNLEAVSTTNDEQDTNLPQRKGMQMAEQGEFTLTGYSSYEAMSSFVDGNAEITDGKLFTSGSDAMQCILSEELATLNNIKVNDTITLTNPAKEKESWKLKVIGIYTSKDAADDGMDMTRTDPANQIYLSYEALHTMVEASQKSEDTALRAQTKGTYTFADVEAYEQFEAQARELGLSEDYTIQSQDITAYEQRLAPLENLSTYAAYFLIVILSIGAVILVVLNIYHIKARTYEIGVLAAIGMNKRKIALQFLCEIFFVMLLSVTLGCGIGAVSSVPVTNTLLEQTSQSNTQTSFMEPGQREEGMNMEKGRMPQSQQSAVDEISSATDIRVLLKVGGIALLLTLLSGGIAVGVILRYEPLQILANRE